MILRQTLQAARAREALCHQEADGNGNLLPLVVRPPVHVLQQVWESALLERPLEVLISEEFVSDCPERRVRSIQKGLNNLQPTHLPQRDQPHMQATFREQRITAKAYACRAQNEGRQGSYKSYKGLTSGLVC